MTIVKKHKELFGTACLLLALVLCMTSCQNENNSSDIVDESDDALSVLLEITEAEESSSEAEYCVIIMPASASSALVQKANELADGIEEATGAECIVGYDNEDIPKTKSSLKVILGNSDCDESRVALNGLRSNDYVCKKIDGTVVIGGIEDSKTVEAIDKFIKDVLPYSNAEQLMSSSAEFFHLEEYEFNGVKLLGFPMDDFTIICDFDNESAKSVADSVANIILEEIGYSLPVKDMSEKEKNVKELVFEIAEDKADKAYIINEKEDLVIRSKDMYGMLCAAEHFCSALLNEAQTNQIFVNGEWTSIAVECPNPEIIIKHLVFGDDADNELSIDKVSLLGKELEDSQEHILIAGNIDNSVLEYAKKRIAKPYRYTLVDGFEDETSILIIYKEDFVSVDSALADAEAQSVRFSITVTESNQKYDVNYVCPSEKLGEDKISERLSSADDADVVIIEAKTLKSNSKINVEASNKTEKILEDIFDDGISCVYFGAFCDSNEIVASGAEACDYEDLLKYSEFEAKGYCFKIKSINPSLSIINNN